MNAVPRFHKPKMMVKSDGWRVFKQNLNRKRPVPDPIDQTSSDPLAMTYRSHKQSCDFASVHGDKSDRNIVQTGDCDLCFWNINIQQVVAFVRNEPVVKLGWGVAQGVFPY